MILEIYILFISSVLFWWASLLTLACLFISQQQINQMARPATTWRKRVHVPRGLSPDTITAIVEVELTSDIDW